MKKSLIALAAIFTSVGTPLHAEKLPVYLGTDADGIYLSYFNTETGALTQPELAAPFKRPGFLALHPELPILYSIHHGNNVGAFTIGEDASLKLLGESKNPNKGQCHIALDATGGTIAVANYNSGTVTTFEVGKDGKPGKAVTTAQIEGSGPTDRQKGPHTHGVYFDQANRFLFAPDLGADKVAIFPFDAETSSLDTENSFELTTAPGAGPRHMAFSPDEKHAYIINELDATVQVASYEPNSGKLTTIQTINTLPDNFTEFNKTSEIEVHSNGLFVYGSNRGHDSIVVYARDPETGKLTLIQHAPCGGKAPRHFKIDPTGNWLICGHQDSNTISVLSLDPATGMLGEPQSTLETPSPICILFSREPAQ